MRIAIKFILFCLCASTLSAQEFASISIEKENGKYGAVNIDLPLPEPPKRKGKLDNEPLTRPWIVPPIYDTLVLLSTSTYYPSYNRSYRLSLFVARQGTYYSSFYERIDMLYTQSLRSEILKPIFRENSKAVGFKFAPISAKISAHPIALLGENGKWAAGNWDSRYFQNSNYMYDSVGFQSVVNEVKADENTQKGTWIVYKNGKKFYINKDGNPMEWIGNAKYEKYIIKDFNYGKYDMMYMFSKAGKYGIVASEVVLPAIYDSIDAPEQVYKETHSIAFAKQNNLFKLFDLRSAKLVTLPINVTAYRTFFRDVFLKSTEGKWYIFDGIKLSLDSTAYDYLFHNIPGRIFLMNSTKSMSYFGEKRESVIKAAGPGVAMPSVNESYSYVLSNGLIHYKENTNNLQGLKYPNGQIFVPPVFSRVAPSAYTKPEIFDNPNSRPEDWLYEFTKDSVLVIGSVDAKTHNITGHSLCTKCSGYGYTYRETRELVKGETTTYTTSPVQQLKSESFDVKTGTWTKTYSSVSQQVTKTSPDKVLETIDRLECKLCRGKGKTNYVIKWDGKNYVMVKMP